MERYLTAEECAEELRVSKSVILKLLKQRRLVGIEITPGHWRVLSPSQRLREYLIDEPLERVPFLTMYEVAEVMGVKWPTIKWHMNNGSVKPVRVEGGPPCRVFTVKQLRELVANREKLRGRRRMVYSKTIVKWLTAYVADDATPNAEVLAEFLEKAVKLPEPLRSQKVVELWALFDKVNEILRECSQ